MSLPLCKRIHVPLLFASLILLPSLALAQAPPSPSPSPIVERPAPPPPAPRERELWKVNAQAGVLWLSGNSNSLGLSGGAVAVRDDKRNVLTLTLRGAYSSVADPPTNTSPLAKPAAANWLAAVRHDRLFGEPNASDLRANNVFGEGRVTQDKFAGTYLRPELTVGVGHFFVRSKEQTFRTEIGANYQHEWAAANPAPMAMPAINPVDFTQGPSKDYLGGRLAFLYENKFTPYAGFTDTAELTVSWIAAGALPMDDAFRVLFSNVATLSSTISSRVSIKLSNITKINSQPPANVKDQWDNTLEVTIGVTLL